MSSRIEKGGARFKPSIVPRRSAGGATPAAGATPSSSATSQLPSQQSSGSSSRPPPSPSLGPQRQARPPSVRSKGPTGAAPSTTASSAAASQPTATSSRSQSYAFNVSPSIISKPGPSAATRTGINAGGPSASGAKAKPVFRRPSVSKPRPGSRASLTPAPQFAQPAAPAQLGTSVQPSGSSDAFEASTTTTESLDEDAELTAPSAPSIAPPSIGGSRSTRNANAGSIRAGAGRITASASESAAATIVDKVSQPDPFQAPQRPTRTRGATTAHSDASAAIKESASQQEANASVRPQRRAPAASNAADVSTSDANENTAVAASSRKGKGREVTDLDNTSTARSTLQSVKPGSQAAPETASEVTEEEKAAHAANRRLQAAARLQKRRLKRKELSTGKPRRPLSAYLLFVNSVRADRQAQNPEMSLTQLTSEIAAEWRDLEPAQRTKWEAEASLNRQQYDSALESWKLAHPDGVTLGPEDESDMETTSEVDDNGEPVRRKKRRINPLRKAHTVSDDEEEYRKQMYEEGPQLAASRPDPSNVTMADISTVDYKKGRAGPRTFEADRVYKRLVNDRRVAARSAVLGEHVLGEKANNLSPSPAPATARVVRTTNGAPVEVGSEEILDGEEEVIGDQTGDDDDDASEPETDADGTTDGEGGASSSRRARNKREASVAGTDVSFNENRFAVQTRIVDGKIVIDETSLFANYGNGEDDRDNMEVVDEREGDRFVNASTYSRKLARNRKWSADETAKFYRSLQQWGTDFEMIARLFPGRDRVMIKKKFNVEERSNAKLVDEALRNSVPVNLEAYAQAIGVDLSGPPPEIKADLQDIEALTANATDATIKKREGTAPIGGKRGERSDAEDNDDDDDGYEYEEVVEIDDDGNEQVIRRRLGKKAGGKAGKKRRNSTRKNSTSTPAPPAPQPAASTGSNAVGQDATEGASRAGGPPSIGSRKSTRSTRNRAASINNSSREAPGDGMEVEEIIGEFDIMGFFYPPNYSQASFDLSRATEQAVTLGAFATISAVGGEASNFTGPVHVVNGAKNYIFCSSNCWAKGQDGKSIPESVQMLYPQTKNFSSYIAEDTGHAITPHYSQPMIAEEIVSWVMEQGL